MIFFNRIFMHTAQCTAILNLVWQWEKPMEIDMPMWPMLPLHDRASNAVYMYTKPQSRSYNTHIVCDYRNLSKSMINAICLYVYAIQFRQWMSVNCLSNHPTMDNQIVRISFSPSYTEPPHRSFILCDATERKATQIQTNVCVARSGLICLSVRYLTGMVTIYLICSEYRTEPKKREKHYDVYAYNIAYCQFHRRIAYVFSRMEIFVYEIVTKHGKATVLFEAIPTNN